MSAASPRMLPAAIVQRLTGLQPDAQAVNSAVDASLKG